MQDAETTLAIIRERAKKGLSTQGMYRRLYHPGLYPADTSAEQVASIVDALRLERHRWGKCPQLDAFLLEAMRSLLRAHFEPRFADASHGFRPGRGCRSALRNLRGRWRGIRRIITIDLNAHLGAFSDEVVRATLARSIDDNRFLRLVVNLVRAGGLADWRSPGTWSGTPRGGPLGPILANACLDRLDRMIEASEESSLAGYLRHAGSIVVGLDADGRDADAVGERMRRFLVDDLGLPETAVEVRSVDPRSTPASFLGHEVVVDRGGRVALRMPARVLRAEVARYGVGRRRRSRLDEPDHRIVARYAREFRRFVRFYRLSRNLAWADRLRWAMRQALLNDLARKHRASVAEMARRYVRSAPTVDGPRRCVEVATRLESGQALVSRFGDVSLRHDRREAPSFLSVALPVSTTGEPDEAKVSCPVRRGTVGAGLDRRSGTSPPFYPMLIDSGLNDRPKPLNAPRSAEPHRGSA